MKSSSKVSETGQHGQNEYGGEIVRAILMWCVGLVGTAIAVAIGYFWLDRPIALWVHQHSLYLPQNLAQWLATNISGSLTPVAAVISFGLVVRWIVLRSVPRSYEEVALICCLSVLITEAIKSQLKSLFGRAWPETWFNNNPSFIRDGDYGFHFMHGNYVYQSFPSGHMAITCAVISVLWVLRPKWRWFYSIVVLMVGSGLILTNLHFLSDVVAGAFVGVSIGGALVVVWTKTRRKGGSG